MGLSGISISSIVLILVIVLLIFGGKRLRHLGEDLGRALRGLRKGLKEDHAEESSKNSQPKE